jgi:hypothetical protein
MSNDPIQPERRPLPYPGELPRDPYNPPSLTGDPKAAKKRLLVPGIFVILIGVMNLVPGGCCLSIGLMAQTVPDATIEQAATKRSPGEMEKARQQGQDPIAMAKGFYFYGGIGVSVVSVLLMLLAMVGGGCMIAGRSLFLCSMGALAAILSPGGFGVLGLAVGIWAMVVLFNEEVRTAFRAPS